MSPRLRNLLLIAGVWAFLVLYFASWDMLTADQPLQRALLLNLGQVTVWAGLSLVLLAVGRSQKVSVLARGIWKPILVNLAALAGLAAAGLALSWLVLEAVGTAGAQALYGLSFHDYCRDHLHPFLLILLSVAAVQQYVLIGREAQGREAAQARLESSLARAKNQLLLSRLQPHFLYNAMNSIAALIHSDPEGADRMLTMLGDLLRMALESAPSPMIPLRQEVDMVATYLAIEQIRFQDRLQVHLEVPARLAKVLVPQFILQPLVENCLRHGIGPKVAGGRLEVKVSHEGDALLLVVQDDGMGFESLHEGVGLSNLRARMALLYPEGQPLEIFSLANKGTRVVVRIPL